MDASSITRLFKPGERKWKKTWQKRLFSWKTSPITQAVGHLKSFSFSNVLLLHPLPPHLFPFIVGVQTLTDNVAKLTWLKDGYCISSDNERHNKAPDRSVKYESEHPLHCYIPPLLSSFNSCKSCCYFHPSILSHPPPIAHHSSWNFNLLSTFHNTD